MNKPSETDSTSRAISVIGTTGAGMGVLDTNQQKIHDKFLVLPAAGCAGLLAFAISNSVLLALIILLSIVLVYTAYHAVKGTSTSSETIMALTHFSCAAKRRLDAFWAHEDEQYRQNKIRYVNIGFYKFVALFLTIAIVVAIALL